MKRDMDNEARIADLLARMTLDEKVGQLVQVSSDWRATGPVSFKGRLRDDLVEGRIGSMLNVLGTRYTRAYQELALQSRLGIPLLFGMDVIHGYLTTFPIPLGEAASFDLSAIERSARIAATEAAAAGIHWTFAPMVDVGRDPRWGRVMEGAGEDTFLGARIAAARVRGFQGRLGDTDAVLATAKHFAGYGWATGGRDYNTVDMSERMLREVILPPFKAAVDAGAATFMNAFNDLNGVPATGSALLQRRILKGEWGFQGLMVSDWGSIGEMQAHGHAADHRDAARKAIEAGCDMDMESHAYSAHLAALVLDGVVAESVVDEAVRRVLRCKFALGLFDDPFRFCDESRERRTLGRAEHRRAARDIAARSIVLLKNEGGVLPIRLGAGAADSNGGHREAGQVPTIALIGPLATAQMEHHGAWSVTLPEFDYAPFITSHLQGLRERVGQAARVLCAPGCDLEGERRDGFAEAVALAEQADVVIVSVGESAAMSGEAKSRARLGLPGVQEELIRALHATGKPLVVVVNAGRPLVLEWVAEQVPAIVYAWWLGSEAGHALADVLFGDVNPAARLPMTFVRDEGQIPLHYNHPNTGRPWRADAGTAYIGGYIDMTPTPRWAFGHGLSYTHFDYGTPTFEVSGRQAAVGSVPRLRAGESGVLRLMLRNTGTMDGDEVVQLYLRDRVASLVRPVKELKGWQRVHLAAGQSREVSFTIERDLLGFWNDRGQWQVEPGEFELMIGASSADIRQRVVFEWME